MRIQFLASSLPRGGAETMAVNLSRVLSGRGHDVRWSLLRDLGELGEEAAQDLPFETHLAPSKWHLLRAGKWLRSVSGVDALYSLDHENAVVLVALARPWDRIQRRVVAIHTTGLWGGHKSLSRWFRWALGAFHRVLALSPGHQEYITRTEGVDPRKVSVVSNGIDLTRFDPGADKSALRRELGVPVESVLAVNVAILRPEKNHVGLLEALREAQKHTESLHLVLVGDGPEKDALQAYSKQWGLEPHVTFLGKRTDVARILPAFDFFVLSSHPLVETQPVSVLEAMASGLPVLATRVGDVAGILEPGDAGVLVEAGDVRALSGAMTNLAADDNLRKVLREKGMERVQAYTIQASADALEAVLGA